MQHWANNWQMSFNLDKCKFMRFGKKYKTKLGHGKQPHEIEKMLKKICAQVDIKRPQVGQLS